MRQWTVRMLILLSGSFLLTACSQQAGPPRVVAEKNEAAPTPKDASTTRDKPPPPLALTVPAASPDHLDGEDLKAMEAGELFGRARRAMDKGDYPQAATFQYWYVQQAARGQYDLACFLARSGQIDAAFYWLQLAARDEGVDTPWAQEDGDLAPLRRDPRWGKVHQYLVDCNRFYETCPHGRTTLVVPENYKREKAIPVVLWLHGIGSEPEDFVPGTCQAYADGLQVAFAGVSGTKERGPHSFAWAEEPEQDARRLGHALTEISDRVTVKKGCVVAFGFSQGAQVAVEVAARFPEEYAGAIALSPGLRGQRHWDEIKPSPLLTRCGFVLSCGGKEHPATLEMTNADVQWLGRANAQVLHKVYPEKSIHSFPDDFAERFSEWVQFVLKARMD